MTTTPSAGFYLFASPSKTPEDSPSTVFYEVEGEPLAQSLCHLFTREYSDADGIPTFHCKAVSLVSVEERVLLNEALAWLSVYDEPDTGAYDALPPKHTLFLAQCAVRARTFEESLRRESDSGNQDRPTGSSDAAQASPPNVGDLPAMSAEERRNSGLNVLMLLAQAYYKILESTFSTASWFTALDLRLNHSYLWTITNITNLLKNHEGLEDFPIPFEPVFSNLYPSNIRDVDWEDMVAPDAEQFLGTVQQYVYSKGAYNPKEGSLGWGFVELFRVGVNDAIKGAEDYEERMRRQTDAFKKRIRQPSKQTISQTGDTLSADNTFISARDTVFISYSHKDTKHLKELRTHLKPLERAGRVSPWSDTQIAPSSKWFDEINAALARTSVALMLVSSDFLNSDFIDEHELGPLLKEAEAGGVKILWVLIRDCLYRETPLAQYQAVLPPDQPVAKMRAPERDTAWRKVCEAIKQAANQP